VKTAKEIVEHLKIHPVTSAPHAEEVDAMLHERAKAFRGQPAEKIESLLAWAVSSVTSATRMLSDATADDSARATEAILAAQRGDSKSSLRGFSWSASKTDACRVQLECAVETLRRVLDVYEATAKDG
jgi:hypothetical protein